MSNALYPAISWLAQLAQTTAAPMEQDEVIPVTPDLTLAIIGLGLCVLLPWLIRRIVNPHKFLLSRIPARQNSLTPLHALAPLLAWMLTSVAVIHLGELFGSSREDTYLQLLSGAAGQLALIAATLFLAAYTFRNGLINGFGLSLRHWVLDSLRALAGYLAAMPLVFAAFAAMTVMVPKEYQFTHEMLLALNNLSGGWVALVTLSILVLAPLAEELFFRGLVQSMVRRYINSPWLAIVLTSAVFALIHAPYWHTIPALFMLSLVLGYNYERTGRLLSCVLIHSLFNAVNLLEYLSSGN